MDWLEWLRRSVGFESRAVSIDCCDTEIAAIRESWPSASIMLCHWHLMRSISSQAKVKVCAHTKPNKSSLLKLRRITASSPDVQGLTRGEKAAANASLRNKAVCDFRALLDSTTEEELDSKLASYTSAWSSHPAWLSYIQKQWLTMKDKWCQAWRQVSRLCEN